MSQAKLLRVVETIRAQAAQAEEYAGQLRAQAEFIRSVAETGSEPVCRLMLKALKIEAPNFLPKQEN